MCWTVAASLRRESAFPSDSGRIRIPGTCRQQNVTRGMWAATMTSVRRRPGPCGEACLTVSLPAVQRSAWLMAPGEVAVREVPLDRPGPGEVLVRIERALVGGTDRKAYARGHPQIPMPGPFGHRYAGTVAALGAGAPPFEVGQPVMGVHSAPCLDCPLCHKGRQHLCPHVMKEKVLGAFGQYLCLPAPVARQ